MGGGGISSSSLKQLLPTELLDTNTTFLYNGLNITLSVDSQMWSPDQDINRSIIGACNEYNYAWHTNDVPFPHFYQVDFGTEVTIQKVCFNPISDNIVCIFREYNIQYSSDRINYKNIYPTNKIYDPSKGYIGVIAASDIIQYYEDCINEFDPINTRYIKIVMYNTYDYRGYKWAGFCNLRIYGNIRSKVFLDKNNYIYGVG